MPSENHVPQAIRGILDLSQWDFRESGQIPLEGEWKFVWDELRSPREMADSEDLSYAYVPDKWNHYVISGENLSARGYGTFSLTLILSGEEEYYGFSFDGVGSAYSVWMNGEPLMKSGIVGTSKERMYPEKIPQTVIFKSTGEPLEIVIQISNFHHKKGGFRNSLYIGRPEQIQNAQRKGLILEAFTLGILFIMGLYHLAEYFFRRKFKSALYFSLLCFFFLMRLGITNQDLFLLIMPSLSWTIAFYLEYISLFFIPTLVSLFYHRLFPGEIPRYFVRALTVIGSAFSLFVIFTGTYVGSYTAKYFQYLIFLEIGYYFYFLFLINRRKREGALAITIASLILFITSAIEIFSLWDWFGSGKIGVYGFLSFILVQAILLSRRYSQAFTRVESLTEELQDSEIRYRNFFDNSLDILFLTDRESRIIDVSPSCQKMLGYSREELINRKATEIIRGENHESLFDSFHGSGEPVRNIETVLTHRDGHGIETLLTMSLRLDEKGLTTGIQGSVHDYTDKKRAEREKLRAMELEQIALTDPLTNVYNRRFFSEVARKERERAQRKEIPLSFVMLDIDFFKSINDRYGHLKGDEVLVNLTSLCQEHIRSTDIFARFGGEEFVILFPEADSKETEKLVERLREEVARTVIARCGGEEIRITVSMGISCWNPGQETEVNELLNQADRALYEAKKFGRNRIVQFSDNPRAIRKS